MNNQNHAWNRQIVRVARKLAKKYGLKPSDVRPQSLVLYAKLNPQDSQLIFRTDRSKGAFPLENLLDDNDAFVADGISLALHQVIIDDGTEYPGNTSPVYFPDPNIFTGPAVDVATEAQSLEMLYNAKLRLETDQHIRIKDLPTGNFRVSRTTQGSAATSNEQYGFEIQPLTSAIKMVGGSRNEVVISIAGESGDYSAIGGVADTTQNYAVIVLTGAVLVGGAKKAIAGKLNEFIND